MLANTQQPLPRFQITTPTRALIVEAQRPDRQTLRLHLELAGFEVEEAADGRAALDRLRSTRYGLVLLDFALPSIDGLALCRAVRAEGPNTDAAVLMVTARDSEADKVLGLSSGADDYVTKPFSIPELLARVGAVLRRSPRSTRHEEARRPVQSSHLSLDLDRREALVRGRRVELTRQEFDVLHQLAARPGTVFSRAALLRSVWSDDRHANERTVDVAISRLRRKIEGNPHDPELILTAWGVGYKFAADSELRAASHYITANRQG
jgi:two-component system, OmpR family, response regulator